jgi:hypothetical protein
MMRNGWGGGFAILQCYGCGFEERTNDAGATWEVVREVGGNEPPKAQVEA